MSTITVDGRLTADATLRFTPNGRAVLNFDLAENHRRRNGDQWEDDGATFYRVSVWGKRAENLAEELTKGTPVLVTGEFRTREYETRDGGKGRSLDITADTVGLIPVGERRQQQAPASSTAQDPWGSQQGGFADTEPPF